MRFIPFDFEHLRDLRVIPDQKTDWQEILEADDRIRDLMDQSDAETLTDGRQLLACMGLTPYASGLAAWIFIDQAARSRPIAFSRAVRRRLQERVRAHEGPVYGHATTASQAKWLRMLGFESEAYVEFNYNRYLLRTDRDRASAA